MVKNTKTWISWEQNIIFLRNKKIPNLCFILHILRSYCLVAEVTFKVYHNVKVQRRAFEMKQPKNVRLKKYAKRLACACTYHGNIDHMRKSLNHLSLINDIPLIKNNADFVDRALCSSDKIACIAGICRSCINFKK